jgi:L-fuculose-phosphate aldolase
MIMEYMDIREEMAVTARLIWERRLTNAAGGNFAVKVTDNRILISPSMMSEEKHCYLEPEDFLLIDYEQSLLEGSGRLSRESLMHVLILQNFKEIRCTIHAHPFYCMPFVVWGKPIPNVSEATMGRGYVGVVPYTKAYTEELSRNIYNYFEKHRKLAVQKPIGVIMAKHGVVVSGGNIYKAYSMLERIEADAYCITVQNQI